MHKEKTLIPANAPFELHTTPEDAVIVYRQLFGKTARDLAIEQLPVPSKPLQVTIMIKMIRIYQKYVSGRLGNRCVFDPSCSHYAEMAFRKKGLLKGTRLTFKRLCRCRPENGGTDELI